MPHSTNKVEVLEERYDFLTFELEDFEARTEKTFRVGIICCLIGIVFFPLLIIGAIYLVLYKWGRGKIADIREELRDLQAELKDNDA